MELEIIYQDDALLAVNKPSGMLVHRGYAQDPLVMTDLVRDYLGGTCHPSHRLDRGTSGVLLFSKNPEQARIVQGAFARREVEKRYLCLVRGVPPKSGVIDHPIPRRRKDPHRVPAITEYRRLFVFRKRYSIVEARPKTGRQHQIRRHLKHISCPLIGDANYGKGEHNRFFRQHFNLRRLVLHAASLTVPHPGSGELLTIEAPLTPDLVDAFSRMEIPDSIFAF